MKSNTDYKLDKNFALLLVGDPKTGKTCLSMAFPDPYFLDLDRNLSSAVRRNPARKFKYDVVDEDDKGNIIEPMFRLQKAEDFIKAAALDPEVKTIIVDSVTTLNGIIIAHILGKLSAMGLDKKLRQDTLDQQLRMADYNTFLTFFSRFVAQCRATRKFVIFTAHQKAEKDEVIGGFRYEIAMPGQLKNNLGGYFTDVWGLMTTPMPGNQTKYEVRTRPTGLHISLGTSMDVPPVIDITNKTPEQFWAVIGPKIT
jgi:hypothetical protein